VIERVIGGVQLAESHHIRVDHIHQRQGQRLLDFLTEGEREREDDAVEET
jgi:hypothetical protein